MKRATILALLADELEALTDPEYKPLPGVIGVVLRSTARDVLTLEQRTKTEIVAASTAAVTRQAGRYLRTQKQKDEKSTIEVLDYKPPRDPAERRMEYVPEGHTQIDGRPRY